jgi:hypothetical protein
VSTSSDAARPSSGSAVCVRRGRDGGRCPARAHRHPLCSPTPDRRRRGPEAPRTMAIARPLRPGHALDTMQANRSGRRSARTGHRVPAPVRVEPAAEDPQQLVRRPKPGPSLRAHGDRTRVAQEEILPRGAASVAERRGDDAQRERAARACRRQDRSRRRAARGFPAGRVRSSAQRPHVATPSDASGASPSTSSTPSRSGRRHRPRPGTHRRRDRSGRGTLGTRRRAAPGAGGMVRWRATRSSCCSGSATR